MSERNKKPEETDAHREDDSPPQAPALPSDLWDGYPTWFLALLIFLMTHLITFIGYGSLLSQADHHPGGPRLSPVSPECIDVSRSIEKIERNRNKKHKKLFH